MATELKRMRQLIGTPADWLANDLVLGDGELAFARDPTRVRVKLGDGGKRFSELMNLFDAKQLDYLPADGGTLMSQQVFNDAQRKVNLRSNSVFRFMTDAEIADVQAGTFLIDVTAKIQQALDACRTTFFPIGGYRISAPLVMPWQGQIYGEHETYTIIRGFHAGQVIQIGVNSGNCVVQNLALQGTGCTGIGPIPIPPRPPELPAGDPWPPSAYWGYLISLRLHHVSFGYELAYGLNGNCIFLDMYKCAFGSEGYGPRVPANVHIRSAGDGTLNTNMNSVRNTVFHQGTKASGQGAASAVAVQVSAGTVWMFDFCDWEQGGRAFAADNVSNVLFTNCWFEALTSNAQILDFGFLFSKAVFRNCHFEGMSPVTGVIQWNSGQAGLTVDECTIGIDNTAYAIYDNATGATGVDGKGKVRWTDNFITGGNATMVTKTGLSRQSGNTAMKGWAVINTATLAVIAASEDGITCGSNGAAGYFNMNIGATFARDSAHVWVQVTTQNAASGRGWGTGPTGNYLTIQVYNTAGAPMNDIISVCWGGS